MSAPQKVPTGTFSPFYGCAIMIMAALTFGGIITWAVYTYYQQDKTIAGITQNEPAKIAPTELPADARAALEKRLADFAAAARAGTPAELKLSIEEINAVIALAPDSGYGGYADKVRVEKTDPAANTLITQASLPMNKKFWEEGQRYLIGEVAFHIYVHEPGVDAKVVDVKVPGRHVEPGLINDMGIWPWLAPYQKLEPLGAALKGIRKAVVTADGLTLSTQS